MLVGIPPEPLEIGGFNVVKGLRSYAGLNIGGIRETQERLDFYTEHAMTADIELVNTERINQEFGRLEKGNVKYRFIVDMKTLSA